MGRITRKRVLVIGGMVAAPLRPGAQTLPPKNCGLFVLESGPFLRGKLYSDGLLRDTDGGDIPRNLGDQLAFEALYAKMASMNMMDWTPDGLVLSKLEGPTGDQAGSQAIDAKQAQLFNICVQGPALARSWTGQPLLQCMPMDKVFVVVVADVSTELGAKPTTTTNAEPTNDEYVQVIVELHKKLAKRNLTELLRAVNKTLAPADGRALLTSRSEGLSPGEDGTYRFTEAWARRFTTDLQHRDRLGGHVLANRRAKHRIRPR